MQSETFIYPRSAGLFDIVSTLQHVSFGWFPAYEENKATTRDPEVNNDIDNPTVHVRDIV